MTYITKKDLQNNVRGLDAYTPGDESTKDLSLASTSGSTGNPLLIANKFFPQKAKRWIYERVMHHMSVGTRRQITLRLCWILLHRGNVCKRALILDRKETEQVSLPWILQEFKPSSLSGLPTIYLEKLLSLKNYKDVVASITNFVIGSGIITPLVYDQLKKLKPSAEITVAYHMTETIAAVGESCPETIRNFHNVKGGCSPVHPNNAEITILDPDSNGWGEVVISTHEIDKYRTGDSGKIIYEECKCGAPYTLLVRGRAFQDKLECCGATFISEEIKRVMAPLKPWVHDYRIDIFETKHANTIRGNVRFNIIPNPTLTQTIDKSFLIHEISTNLYVTKSRTLHQLITKKLFNPMEVCFLKEFSDTEKPVMLRRLSY